MALLLLFFITILVVNIRFVFQTHISYLAEPETWTGKIVKAWYETCPHTEDSYHPNSPIGVVIAGREMFGDQFESTLDTLLACNHKLDSKDSIGLTPLHSAIIIGDLESVKVLIEKGANREILLSGKVSEKYGQLTALGLAQALDDKPSIVKYLESLP